MMVLIAVLAFNDRYGKTLALMDKRCLRLTTEKSRDKVCDAIEAVGRPFEVNKVNKGFRISMKTEAIEVHIKPLGNDSSEIILERKEGASEAMVEAVKTAIAV
jgi:hypothetical protein